MFKKWLIAVPVTAGTIAALSVVGGGSGAGVGALAPSFASPEIGMEVLDMMCAEQGGTAYNTPFHISRCQEANTRPGFAIEERVCEGLLGATFNSAPSTGRPKRTTWVCTPGAG